jgi:hypothetical protein
MPHQPAETAHKAEPTAGLKSACRRAFDNVQRFQHDRFWRQLRRDQIRD